ncbi:MAG TPA: tRNA pseudouridine(38-40) synthase TruA [Lacunisphaera sp.]|nr:tRNA pseudouridine(38-40) synthase TruA [Lacunisphaera sp.]
MNRHPPATLPRWKCVCAYDGSSFSGWQSQASKDAVQDVIERRLEAVLGAKVRIQSSGRTDAGVHALGQVFHFDAAWRHGGDKLLVALQVGLPRSIQLKSVRPASARFHARFDAKGKIYRYHLYLGEADPFTTAYCWSVGRPLDWAAMTAAAKVLRGRHDFWAFSGENDRTYETTIRDLRRVELARRGRRATFTFEADGFLYKMVRSLTGALVNAGRGKLTTDEIAALLKTRKRVPAVLTAPPHGLFLVKVLY